ncbi:nicotinate phosphoribosyltransferase [Granulosicoccaceae sp. 1_MG-2023]|nr:nicotinate phosphoribosyltransferase [Granulosicoccaceae sp. 1_MG-2023]
MIDIAKRVYDHQWNIDPIIRSLLDTDFYKLLMAQMVYRRHRHVDVTFGLHNRATHVPLAKLIDEDELRAQLDHARQVSLSRGEVTWLRGNTFYGKERMFSPEFIDWFESFRLPDYELHKDGDQYHFEVRGPWHETMMWEMPVLAIVSELRSRAALNQMPKFDLQVLYARATSRLWEKIERLRKLPELRIADFGTRRRHGFLWQDWCVQAMIEGLGERFLGTSNCLIALRREVEAIGTNAHELPMVYAALADDDQALANAPYQVLADWQEDYEGNLRIALPDTYGTENFLKKAPPWLAKWTGIRIDSGDPANGAELAIQWWQQHGENPAEKMIIFSDGLSVDEIERLYYRFHGKVRLGFGWGTLLTNDFRGLRGDELNPFSLVCKAYEANGRRTVKLSDNVHKAMGPAEEIARYVRVFGAGAQQQDDVIV